MAANLLTIHQVAPLELTHNPPGGTQTPPHLTQGYFSSMNLVLLTFTRNLTLSKRVTYRVVEESFDTAYDRGVDRAVGDLPVHATEEVEQAVQAIQLNEPDHKTVGKRT